MKLRTSIATLALAAGMVFLSSCTEETTPPIVGGFGIPTDVKINATSAATISARWTRAGDDTGTDTLIVMAGGVELKSTTTGSQAEVAGLVPGVEYTVHVASTGGRSAGMIWYTGIRSGVLTIYETADNTPGHGSGLILSGAGGASVVSITGPQASNVDLVLASTDNTHPSPFISLQSASGAGSGIPSGRRTVMSDAVYAIEGGLAEDYNSTGFAGEFTQDYLGFEEFADAAYMGKSAVAYVMTADDNYARIEIVEQGDGRIWKDVGGYRAIDVVVSYNPTADKAYAGRPRVARRGTNEVVRFARPVTRGR